MDKPSSHARSSKSKSQKFDEVDKRILIPMTRMKMQMNLKMNANSSDSSSKDTHLLRTGIDQYRNLQHLNTTNNARQSRGSAEHAAERGLSLMDRKEFVGTIPYLNEALKTLSLSSSDWSTTSSTVKLYHQRGLCFLAAKKYKAAIEDLSRVMQMTPKSAELYAKRGKAYAALGEHHAAMLDYNEAISLAATQGLLHDLSTMATKNDGQFSNAGLVQLRGLYLARARVYKAMNNITHALEDLCHAENSAGGHRDANLYFDRAQLYLQCHQDPLALRDFDRFLELQEELEESRHFDASGGVGGLAGFVAPQELIVESRVRVLDVLVERSKLLQRLAFEEDTRERKDAELAAVEQGQATQSSQKSSPTNKRELKLAYTTILSKPEPYRGIESRRLEKRALQGYTKALELEPRNVETLRLRGKAFMHLGRYEDALMDLNFALEVNPQDFRVAMARAKLYRQRGDLKAAVDEVTAVLQVNGFFINGLKMRAQLYTELEMIQAAENDYSSIIHAHFDKSEVEEAAATTKITMELSSGRAVHVGNLGKGKGRTSRASKPSGKIRSEVAASALLCRARLRLASDQFNAAEEDYQAILNSFANNMEAQLELQQTRERRLVFEQRKQLEALAWLEQNADKEDGVGVSNTNENATFSKNKRKKKTKKKKAVNSSGHATKDRFSVGYVLLEDEEERQEREVQQRIQQQVRQERLLKPNKLRRDNKETKDESSDRPRSHATIEALDLEQDKQKNETNDNGITEQSSTNFETAKWLNESMSVDLCDKESRLSDTKQASKECIAVSMRHNAKAMEVAPTPPPVVVASVMTRDEAWESMWDEEAGEHVELGAVRIENQAHSNLGQVETEHEACDKEASLNKHNCRAKDEDQSCRPLVGSATCTVDGEINEEASDSSDDGKNGHIKAKAVLVDEKYLKKRERQLKKLRISLQHASNERDKGAINEALARAERKQMSDSLQDDVQRAHDILADMANETQRLCDPLPPTGALSNSNVNSERSQMHLHNVTSPSSATSGPLKPSSLVIRPIAYGQALQAAEQYQHQLRTHQKLLKEKNAEIAKLQKLLAQIGPSPIMAHEKAQSVDARANAKTAILARRMNRLRTHFPVQSGAARQAEALIEWMGPSEAADRARQQVVSFVQQIITAHFPPAAASLFFATGSYPMKTYLPGSDLDICLLIPQELETSWYYIVMQALCVAGSSGGAGTVLEMGNAMDANGSTSACAPSAAVGRNGGSLFLTNTVRNVTFINADVRVVKCTIDNISVDITANRVGALGAVRLLDAMAARVGRHYLFKKSIILIKAWCTHESSDFMQTASAETSGGLVLGSTPSSVMGASHGAFSTYAVNTIVMTLFNQHGDMLSHPLQALYLFLDQLAEFPWHDSALTLHGAVPLSQLATAPVHGTTLYKSKLTTGGLDAGDIQAIRDTLADQFGAFDADLTNHKGTSTSLFPVRACNIVDPLNDKNNLARSVSPEVFPVLKCAFRLARDQLAAMLAPESLHKDDDTEPLSEEIKNDKVFFARCWQLYGRGDGWRPDLLIHPRQTWHGRLATTSIKKSKMSPRGQVTTALAKTDENKDSPWESLLPSLEAGAVNALMLQYQQLQHQAAAAYHHGTMIANQQPYYGPLPQHGHPMGSPRSTASVSGVQTNGNTVEPLPAIIDHVSNYPTTLHHPHEIFLHQRSKSPPQTNTVGPQNVKTVAVDGCIADATSPLRM